MWKEYFERYSGTNCSPNFWFDEIRSDNYFTGEPLGRAERKVRVGKLKNAGKDEITGKI